jgi:hypothetical protein
MIWMPHRVQPRFIWTAILLGTLIANAPLAANAGEPVGNGTGVTGGGAAPASGGARAAVVERSSGPAEVSRAVQPAAVARTREAAVQNGPVVRAEAGGERVVRGPENVASARETVPNSGAAAGGRNIAIYGNAWTDPVRAGQQQRYYTANQYNNNRQNGYRHRSRGYPYLYQYYGGYYPIYVDVPVAGDYFDGGADINSGYDGGPAVVPDPGANGGAPAPPGNIAVSPQNDDGQAAANPANPNPDASPTPNPAIGPDSLVEAVQSELARRGYFQGKVDAMFRADTEAALRKFQQDNYLAPTGHLNEPTLHALNLD